MSSTVAGARRLRELLASPDSIVAPGAYDALSARLIDQAGFSAVYMTGFGTSASLLGRPDVGLLTMTEMVATARRIVSTVSVPVIADADTGYGNALNVMRTVAEFEAAGVAGIHLEDQVTPKRCGHMDGKQIVDTDTAVDKVRAAVAARSNPDFVLIARTDARATDGLAAAIDRGHRFREAGADCLFIEALHDENEIRTVASEFADIPLLFNWLEHGRTPPLPLTTIIELGFRIVIYPTTTLLAATRAIQAVLQSVVQDGSPERVLDALPGFDEFTTLVGMGEVRRIAAQFGAR